MPLPADIAERWRRAAEEDRALRSASAALPQVLYCERDGVRVGPVTILHLAKLDAIRSPYLGYGDGKITPADLARAWLILRDADWSERASFLRRHWELRWVRRRPGMVHELICESLETALRDLPPTRSSAGNKRGESFILVLIDALASEYGWTLHEIVRLPALTAVALLRCMVRRKDPDCPMGTRADRLIQEWVNTHAG